MMLRPLSNLFPCFLSFVFFFLSFSFPLWRSGRFLQWVVTYIFFSFVFKVYSKAGGECETSAFHGSIPPNQKSKMLSGSSCFFGSYFYPEIISWSPGSSSSLVLSRSCCGWVFFFVCCFPCLFTTPPLPNPNSLVMWVGASSYLTKISYHHS